MKIFSIVPLLTAVRISLSVIISLPILGSLLYSQETLFHDGFENYAIGPISAESGQESSWTILQGGSNPDAVRIVEDTEDIFGYGTGNRFLRIENGVGFNLSALHVSAAELVTMSFDFVGRRTSISSGGAERLSVQFYGGDGSASPANRVHILSLQNGSEIRTNAGTYQSDERLRFDVIINNSNEIINYETPDGTKSLAAGLADVWIDGALAATDYSFARDAGMTSGPIRSFAFQTFSTDRFSLDLDNFTVFEGAHVLQTIGVADESGRGTLIQLGG